MIDMTILIVGLIAVIALAVVFFGMTDRGGDGSSPLMSGLSTVKKFFDKTKRKPNVKAAVIYINIFYENLQTMIERRDLTNIREQVENEVLQLCRYGRGEAAQVDGNNYIVATDLPRDEVEDFCKNFLKADRKGFKLIDAYVGAYITSGEETEFQKAAGFAKKASRAAKNPAQEGNYIVADKDSLKYIIENDNIERNIENFIDNNNFYQMYMPFFDARTGAIAGGEALTRLRNDKNSDILPGKFLNAIEKEKLYGKFDMYVFERCCEWAAKRSDWGLFVACNFAKSTLCDEGAVDNILSIAAKSGIKNSAMVIEIAKDDPDQDEEIFKKNMARLRQAGFKLCLDIFGKGYTSLGDISALSPDIINLDKSLLYNGLEGAGRVIFDNVVKLAREINSTIICGGIETEEHKRIAAEAGCDLLQGFYFYKPLGEEEFDNLYKEFKEKEEEEARRAEAEAAAMRKKRKLIETVIEPEKTAEESIEAKSEEKPRPVRQKRTAEITKKTDKEPAAKSKPTAGKKKKSVSKNKNIGILTYLKMRGIL